jgi:hypothetical protein
MRLSFLNNPLALGVDHLQVISLALSTRKIKLLKIFHYAMKMILSAVNFFRDISFQE